MIIKNNGIREYAKANNIYFWQIADKLKMQPSNFSAMLRHELPEDRQEQIMAIITELSEGRTEQ